MAKHAEDNCTTCVKFCCIRCNYNNYAKGCMKTGKPGKYVDWSAFTTTGVPACDEFTPRDWENCPYKEVI